MTQALQNYWQKIAGSRPWVVVAVVVALVLVAYFAAQGYRYLDANRDTSAAEREISRLERAARSQTSGTTVQEAKLVENLVRLEDLRTLFDYPETDTLLAILSETARQTGIDLRSMSVADARVEPLGALQYQVQPISVSILGPTANVQDFLAALHDRVPVVAAAAPSMANLDSDDAVTQIQLKFFLSPEPLPEKDS